MNPKLKSTIGFKLILVFLFSIWVSISVSAQFQNIYPQNCAGATNQFCDDTEYMILDNATVSASVEVSNVGTYLVDVDLTTYITHTFGGDLEIKLISPAGTEVIISTDNGGGADDIFDGTLWDDDAPGTVTDFAHVNLVTSTPLSPEGAMGAFVGEDPNGTWTLEIFDDAGSDIGILSDWCLDVYSHLSPPITNSSTWNNNTPAAINDNSTTTSTIDVVGETDRISDVDLTTYITHTFGSDLEIKLISPEGTEVIISTDNGGGADDVFNGTLWDDDAPGTVTDFAHVNLVTSTPLPPEGAMGAFVGEDPNGTWALEIFDDAGADVGSLNSWSLEIFTSSCSRLIPTISEWGLIVLFLIFMIVGVRSLVFTSLNNKKGLVQK